MNKIAMVQYPLWPNRDSYSPVRFSLCNGREGSGYRGDHCCVRRATHYTTQSYNASFICYVLIYAIRPTFLSCSHGDEVPEEMLPGDPLVILTWTPGAISLPCRAEEVSRKGE
jgi:hypothetical protein